jgi:hypothetical protein
MTGKLKLFTPAGDSTLLEWEKTDADSVERAYGAFEQARREGWAAVVPTPEGARAVESFSPDLEEIYLLRPIAGG